MVKIWAVDSSGNFLGRLPLRREICAVGVYKPFMALISHPHLLPLPLTMMSSHFQEE